MKMIIFDVLNERETDVIIFPFHLQWVTGRDERGAPRVRYRCCLPFLPWETSALDRLSPHQQKSSHCKIKTNSILCKYNTRILLDCEGKGFYIGEKIAALKNCSSVVLIIISVYRERNCYVFLNWIVIAP